MSELVYPLTVVALTFAVCIPGFSLLAVVALRWRRTHLDRWEEAGAASPLMWLAAPSAAPLLALWTSSLHDLLAEEGWVARIAAQVCALDHAGTAPCLDNLFLAGGLTALLSGAAFAGWWRARGPALGEALPPGDPAVRRVAALCASTPPLRALRVDVHEGAGTPAATVGLIRPRVVLDRCFVSAADDGALVAALLHELAHVQGRDPLRLLFADVALGLNPLAGPLRRELARWRQAREAACDAQAVRDGGEPLALASALVQAARFRCGDPVRGAGLTGARGASLRLRLTHLMVDGDRPRRGEGDRWSRLASRWPWLLSACLAASFAPLLFDSGLLALIHRTSEFAWVALLTGS